MSYLSSETPPAAKKFRLDLSIKNTYENNTFLNNQNQNNNCSPLLSYNEEDVFLPEENCKNNSLENCDNNLNEEFIEQALPTTKNLSDLKSLSNQNNDTIKKNLLDHRNDKVSSKLSDCAFDFLSLLNASKSSLNNNVTSEVNDSKIQTPPTFLSFSNSFPPLTPFNLINTLAQKDSLTKLFSNKLDSSDENCLNMSTSPPLPQNVLKLNPNNPVVSSSTSPFLNLSLAMSFFQQANSALNGNDNVNNIKGNAMKKNRVLNHDIKTAAAGILTRGISSPSSQRSRNTTPGVNGSSPAPQLPIPGAVAVAASPAAILFSQDDWSWHRNPAASIRSGGTNKQTPVWKYFVYNKAENLSRCIVGTCTYTLKGPHTSTLACHLKKHPAQYAEFQKLKLQFQAVYTRERNTSQITSSSNVNSNKTFNKSKNLLSANSSLASVSPVSNASSSNTSGITSNALRESDTVSPNEASVGLNFLNAMKPFKNDTFLENKNAIDKQSNENKANLSIITSVANLYTPQNSFNNMKALNLAYAAKNNSTNFLDFGNKFMLPYAGIFNHSKESSIKDFQSNLAVAMTTAAEVATLNNNEEHNKAKKRKKYVDNFNQQNVDLNNKKTTVLGGKTGSSMSEILATLNKRAAAAAAAKNTKIEQEENQESNPHQDSFESQKNKSFLMLPSMHSNQNNKLTSHFPTLERLVSNEDEEDKLTKNNCNLLPNSSTSFHSALDLAISSVKINSFKSENNDNLNLSSKLLFDSNNLENEISSTNKNFLSNFKTNKRKCKKNQKLVELKLALAFLTSGTSLNILKNPFMENFLNSVEISSLNVDNLVKLTDDYYFTLKNSIKEQLTFLSPIKFVLLINFVKRNSNFDLKNSNFIILLSISFYSIKTNEIKNVFLGVRLIKENKPKNIEDTINEIFEEYSLSETKLNKIVVSNANSINFGKYENYVLKSFGEYLAESLIATIIQNKRILELKKNFYAMLSDFYVHFDNISNSKKPNEELNEISLLILNPEDFFTSAKTLLQIKDKFINWLEQIEIKNLTSMFNEYQWNMLAETVQLVSLFQDYIYNIETVEEFCFKTEDSKREKKISQNLTADNVIPTLVEIQKNLDNNFNTLHDVALELKEDLTKRLSHITNVDSINFNGIFIEATILNPSLAQNYLDKKQLDYARNFLQKMVSCNDKSNNKDDNTYKSDVQLSINEQSFDNADIKTKELNSDSAEFVKKYLETCFEENQNDLSFSTKKSSDLIFFWNNFTKNVNLSQLVIERITLTITPISSDCILLNDWSKLLNRNFDNLQISPNASFHIKKKILKSIEQSAFIKLNHNLCQNFYS